MILFAVTIGTASINAQEAPPPPAEKKTPEERAEMMTRNLTKSLDLKPDQQEKVKAIIIKREKEREAMQANAKGKREQMEKQMEDDFQKILNSEQFEKFKKKREEMKKKRMEKRDSQNSDDGLPPPSPPLEERK